MKIFIHIAALIMVISPAYATFQIPEIIEYKNILYETPHEPLANYIAVNKFDITKITQSLCSANWRGYVARWKIMNGYLYLEKVFANACGKEKNEVPLAKVIPNAEGMVKAIWYSGKLKLFKKGTVYNNEEPILILNFSKGQVIE